MLSKREIDLNKSNASFGFEQAKDGHLRTRHCLTDEMWNHFTQDINSKVLSEYS